MVDNTEVQDIQGRLQGVSEFSGNRSCLDRDTLANGAVSHSNIAVTVFRGVV